MTLHLKTVFSCNVLLERFYSLILEFDDRAAFRADKVIVVAVRGLILVPGKPVFESSFIGQTRIGQQFQGAVYGGITYARVVFFHPKVQFFRAQVLSCIDKDLQNMVTLGRGPEPLARQVFRELLNGLAGHN
jgi:hypothetical protein